MKCRWEELRCLDTRFLDFLDDTSLGGLCGGVTNCLDGVASSSDEEEEDESDEEEEDEEDEDDEDELG